VLTVCATLPLLLLGAEVTTLQVGMVDPVGFREPWHLFRVAERAWREVGFLIEHSHRLVGFVVGSCVIVLAIGLWRCDARRWVRWLGVAALVAVSIQGLLGGLRVNLNPLMGKNLALIHGCTAQLVFAILVSLVVVTSRSWRDAASLPAPPRDLRTWSLVLAGLIYVQIIFGAVVRHQDIVLGARAHLFTAFAVVAAVVWFWKLLTDKTANTAALMPRAWLLTGLLVVQLLLGIESWLSRFGSAEWRQLRPVLADSGLLRSLHYLVGSFMFVTAVAIALRAHRQFVPSVGVVPAPVRHQLGGAA
jgi:cytochrome c oxidase assembly protein subunit 15